LYFVVSVQSSTQQRKIELFAQLDSLIIDPEGLQLHFFRSDDNRDSLLLYYQDIQHIYQEVSADLNESQKIYFLYEIACSQVALGKYNKAIVTLKQASKIPAVKNNIVWNADAFISYYLADSYRAIGMLEKSNDIFLSILDIPMVHYDSIIQMNVKECISETYEGLGSYDEAMEMYIELYNYNLRKENYRSASYNLIQMGRIAANIELDTSYFEYYYMANELAVKSGNFARLSNNYVNMGSAYEKAGYPYLGLKYLKKAEEYYQYLRPYGRAYLLLALGNSYFKVDSVKQAIIIVKRARKDALQINVFDLIYHADLQLADYYNSIEKYDSARGYILHAIEISKSLGGNISYQNLYRQISDLSLQIKDYPKAMAYLDSSYNEYDKYDMRVNNEKLTQLREKSDYYIHKNKITQLVSENKLAQERSRRLIITIIGFITALILTIYFTLLIRIRLQQLRESHVHLVKKNIELDKLNKQLNDCELHNLKKVKMDSISGEELIIKDLKKLLIQDKVYLNPELSLRFLADKLNTNTTYLSVIINSHFHCNLRSLINRYRIDKARKMLVSKDYSHYSMEGIASEVGFKSRSGFYQAFKAATGLSPSLYIENYKHVISS
jgi:AraC-like DNA-binding protein